MTDIVTDVWNVGGESSMIFLQQQLASVTLVACLPPGSAWWGLHDGHCWVEIAPLDAAMVNIRAA